ncbi:MAG: hypothetical protein ABSC32_06995 [Steroidobacteraceae bacterium]|jgi:hypothetical protein
MKLPLLVPYMIVAFNITACATLAQLHFLSIGSLRAMAVLWTLAAASWALAYVKRNTYIVMR